MAQSPPDQNFYRTHPHVYPQKPPRNSFDLLIEERTGTISCNYTRPYKPNKISKPDDLSDPLVMRRARRSRTTFTSAQIIQLEQHFSQSKYLTPLRLAQLSAILDIGTNPVKNWFKNRRRRLKIESDQQKQFLYEFMPLSPPASNCSKSEVIDSVRSCNSNSCGSSSSTGIRGLQCLSLNGSDKSTPNALTPSPAPMTQISNLVDHYGESALNPYYNNNHNFYSAYASLTYPYAASSTEYYQPPPPPTSLKHYRLQEQYQPAYPYQFQMEHKPQVRSTKEDFDFRFDSLYYMRMPTSLTSDLTEPAHPKTAMSTNPESCEPITSKGDEKSTPSIDAGSRYGSPVDDANETAINMRVLATNNDNDNGNACSSEDLIAKESSVTSRITIMDNCSETFSKITSDTTNDLAYQCTMDTLIHAYNSHLNGSANVQQFATYCFN